MKKFSLLLLASMTLTASIAMAYSPVEENDSIVCTSKDDGRSKFEAVIKGELAEVYYEDVKGEMMALNLTQHYGSNKVAGFYLSQDKIVASLTLKQGLGLKADFILYKEIKLSNGTIDLTADSLKAKCKKAK